MVINKCFCTRRNPISISAAAIYLACQLEDKRKTQAEICKVTGLTEVTLRKVYKELLENWDDLLPSNYTPAVPLEKAFPTTAITSSRSSAPRVDLIEIASSLDRDKLQQQPESKPGKPNEDKEDTESKGAQTLGLNRPATFWQLPTQFGSSGFRASGEKNQIVSGGMEMNEGGANAQESEQSPDDGAKAATVSVRVEQFPTAPASNVGTVTWPFRQPPSSGSSSSYAQFMQSLKIVSGFPELKGTTGNQNGSKGGGQCDDPL